MKEFSDVLHKIASLIPDGEALLLMFALNGLVCFLVGGVYLIHTRGYGTIGSALGIMGTVWTLLLFPTYIQMPSGDAPVVTKTEIVQQENGEYSSLDRFGDTVYRSPDGSEIVADRIEPMEILSTQPGEKPYVETTVTKKRSLLWWFVETKKNQSVKVFLPTDQPKDTQSRDQ